MATSLRDMYSASYRCALDMCKGIKCSNKKKLIKDNTLFVYNDCKNNAKIRDYVLSKYGKK